MKKLIYENFVAKRGSDTGKIAISILTKGGFGFSAGFMEKYMKQNLQYVALRYAEDKEYQYIGFSFFTNKSEMSGCVKLYRPREKYGIIFTPSFFKKYGISPARHKGKHDVEETEDQKNSTVYAIKIKK